MVFKDKYLVGGLIGNPVDHSISHYLFELYGELCGVPWIHLRLNVDSQKSGGLEKTVEAIRMFGFKGFNITLPYKTEIMQFLDQIDDEANNIGAVNTILNEGGVIKGFNTDWYGGLKNIEEEIRELKSDDNVVLFGAGGAARAITYGLSSKVGLIYVINRTYEKADAISRHSSSFTKIPVYPVHLSDPIVPDLVGNASLVINATSVGLQRGECILSPSIFNSLSENDVSFFDAIYCSDRTSFINNAVNIGKPSSDGSSWMIHQAIRAFKIWTGRTVEPDQVPYIKKKVAEFLSGS